MYQINIHQAKTQFSKLVDAACHGKEVIIAKAGVPVARLVPFEEKTPKRKLGVLKGKIRVSKDFDDSLPSDLLDAFEE